MLRSNFHTHTVFSDGTCKPEAYVLRAIEKGFTALGFSDHQPLFYKNDWTMRAEAIPDYFLEIERLKVKYQSSIEIYTGIELDYHKGREELFLKPFPKNSQGEALTPDYTIGSLHALALSVPQKRGTELVHYLPVDDSAELFELLLKEEFNSDINLMIKENYATLGEMVKGGGFDILGHIDLIKKFNRGDRFFSEDSPVYKKSLLKVLDLISQSNILLEVNTGGLARAKTDTVYPSPEFLFEAYRRNIPVIVGSDSHDLQTMDFYFKETEKLLWEIGYREVATLDKGKWIPVKLSL